LCAIVCSGLASAAAPGQTRTVTQQVAPSRAAATQAAAPNVGADYQLGPTDVISVVVWGEKDLSTEVVIRPDGKISLPLINDVEAAGLTTEQLRRRITELAKRFVETPVVTVVVKQVNNNRAFVTGQVMRPGPYVLSGPTTVLQIIALAGGFTEFADKNHVLITRLENGRQQAFEFNYTQVIKKRDLSQNLILKPGDTVVVP
jgi:polysaccharide export outer membrane protein